MNECGQQHALSPKVMIAAKHDAAPLTRTTSLGPLCPHPGHVITCCPCPCVAPR